MKKWVVGMLESGWWEVLEMKKWVLEMLLKRCLESLVIPGRGKCAGGSRDLTRQLEPEKTMMMSDIKTIILSVTSMMVMMLMTAQANLMHAILKGSDRLLLLLQAGQLLLDCRPLADYHLVITRIIKMIRMTIMVIT